MPANRVPLVVASGRKQALQAGDTLTDPTGAAYVTSNSQAAALPAEVIARLNLAILLR